MEMQEIRTICLGILIAVSIVIISCWCSRDYTQRIDLLTSRGYEQATLPGEGGWAWIKHNK